MSKDILHKLQMGAYKIIAVQFFVVLIGTALFAILSTLHAAYSAFLGGAICIAANGLFAKKIFAQTGASQYKNIMRAFYFGELQKIILTAVLFFIAIKYLNVVFLPFFLMYIIAQFSFWFAPVIIDLNSWQKKNSQPMEQLQ